MSEHFGKTIAEARSNLKLSQAELASALEISQAKVSRIEASESAPNDIRLIAKLARALVRPVSELLPDGFLDEAIRATSHFYAFCPNALCERNSRKLEGGKPFVYYISGDHHEAESFEYVNFCKSCGTALLKECPGCGKRLTESGTRFCVACGERIYRVITAEEWKKIQQELGAPPDDDIPF